MGLYEEVASPVDYNLIVADINNDLRRCAHLKAGALGCGAVSGLSAFWALQRSKHGKPIVLQEVICGLSAVGCLVLEISEIVTLNRDKVYLTPEGVVVRITHSTKQKVIDYR